MPSKQLLKKFNVKTVARSRKSVIEIPKKAAKTTSKKVIPYFGKSTDKCQLSMASELDSQISNSM